MVDSPSDIIELLGGTSAVAKSLGVDPPIVSNWRSRGKIPGDRWASIAALAAKKDVKEITSDVLTAMHARRKRRVAR